MARRGRKKAKLKFYSFNKEKPYLPCLTGAAALTGATTLATTGLTGAALSALPPTRFVLCFLENLKFLKNLASTYFI